MLTAVRAGTAGDEGYRDLQADALARQISDLDGEARLRDHRSGLAEADRRHLDIGADVGVGAGVVHQALNAEGLLADELRDQLTDLDAELPDGETGVPMLLAISDNGTEMHAQDTAKFMALGSITQHFGRPSTPTDQAWTETLWGH